MPLAALTASQLVVRWVDLPAGASLLINGPSGAVGGFAVQLASQAGIEVIAVPISPTSSSRPGAARYPPPSLRATRSPKPLKVTAALSRAACAES